MAKLYAELTSDKGGRIASKGGDDHIYVTVTRSNKILGTLKVRNLKHGYDIFWSGIHIQGGDD
jgi:hypothetical protein